MKLLQRKRRQRRTIRGKYSDLLWSAKRRIPYVSHQNNEQDLPCRSPDL